MGKEKDKQIIIDGVDVSGCVYHEDGYCTISKQAYCYCCDKTNCHYKNWQRKEQECKELKKEAVNLKLNLKKVINLSQKRTDNVISF